MAAQLGSAMLIKVGDGGSPSTFTTIAGLRTKTLTINNETVDVTNSDSQDKARELLAGAGITSMTASGDGVFTDQAVHTTIEQYARQNTQDDYQIVIPGFGTYEGLFQISTFDWGAADHNGEVPFSLTLESAGAIKFTAS